MINKDYLNSLRKKIGIYQIRNLVDGKIYIGSSCNVASRWIEHQHDLKKNEHRNHRLQNAFNKYGEDSFVFEVLELIDKDKKDIQFEREQYWINAKDACNKKKGYNIQSEVLVVPKLVKKVVCLETKEIFSSLKEAGERKNIDPGSISCCCNKRKLKQTGGFHWRFYDEYITMTEEEIQEVIFDVKSYPFICLDDGKVYKSWRELPYKKGSVTRCCNFLAKKEYATCDGKQYMFLKDYEKLTHKEIQEIRNLKPKMSNSGEVVCLETRKTYQNAHKASIKTGISDTGILKCCYKKCHSINKTHWVFKNEYETMLPEQIEDILKKDSYEKCYKPVVCLETKQVFKSITDASVNTNIRINKISQICQNNGVSKSLKGLHFMFLNEYRKSSKEDIQRALNTECKRTRKVCCIETGTIFNSVTEAAESVGGQTTNISKCCKNPNKICKGYHWEYFQSSTT